MDQIERDSKSIDHTGKRAVVPVHTKRNRGRRSISDGGTLPKAQSQGYLDAIVPLRYHTQAIEITDQSIEASKTDQGAFINLLTAETQGASTDLKKDINRQLFGDGTGALTSEELATSTASATEAKFKVKITNDMQYIQVGDIVDLLVATSGAVGTANVPLGTEVVSRSVANKEFKLSANAGAELKEAEKIKVYVSGNWKTEMDGLRNIINTSRELHSINSATAGNELWNAVTQKAGTAAATPAVAGESLFEQVADAVGIAGNGDVELFLTSRGVKRRLADTYQSVKRFNDKGAIEVHGGYSAILVNEVPVISDDDAIKGFAWAINKSAFRWFEQAGPSWLDVGNGQIFQLKVAGTGEYAAVRQAWFKWYAALGCVAPNRTGRIEFCTDDVPV